MFKMDKRSGNCLTLRLSVLIYLCICVLMSHFLIESLGNSETTISIELIEHGQNFDPAHESDEESFVLQLLDFQVVSMRHPKIPVEIKKFTGLSLDPSLPPPKSI